MTSIVRFQGVWGCGDETPHCYLLMIDDFTILLDCGWDEKFEQTYIDRLTKLLPRVDCVLLSYADPLHMGALPYLVGKCHLSCPVYATIPVYKMGQMFMYDWFQNHQNYEDFDTFSLDDVDASFDLITQVKYNQSIPMRGKGLGLNVLALPAGHMIGGSIWRISRDGEEDIVYAVDFNHKKERHLGGCDLSSIHRPSLLITDAFNFSYMQERRRHRDEKFVAQIQETCRGGGNVLVATDTAGRVLEMAHMLEQVWSTRESGLAAYSLVILSNTGYHVVHFAKQMIEWMSEKLTKSFDMNRTNPFAFKQVKFCHSMNDLNRLPNPKVVLASSPDLECGFSRELFIQWAINPKNTIILTSRSGPDTLGRRLIDNPSIRTYRMLEKRRVKLEGSELDKHLQEKRNALLVKKEEIESNPSDSDSDDSDIGLEADKHDIVVLQEKPGQVGQFRSRRHHPMFPFHEEKIRGDDYGEFIDIDDFEAHMKDDAPEVSEIEPVTFTDEVMELDEPPTKCISNQVTVRVAAQIMFIDFEGRSDGESIRKIMKEMNPRRIILVRGSSTDLTAFSQNLNTITEAKVYTPLINEEINASSETHIYQVKLSENLVANLQLQPSSGEEVEVAWINGKISFPKDPKREDEKGQVITNDMIRETDIPSLNCLPIEETPYHHPVFINDMLMSDFKQVLSRSGIGSEFNAGVLWCVNGTIAIRKLETGKISIEGAICEEYFMIRELLYQQFAIL